MHTSSYISMENFYKKYMTGRGKCTVLDVGSQMIDGQQKVGSYKNIFAEEPDIKYVGCDMVDGLNVDIVLADPYKWDNIPEDSFDYVITGQMFEHVEYPWHTMMEIARVLKPGGMCCVIAPSAGPMHNYPLDCYRYYPDGLAALAKYAGLEVVEAYAQWEPDKYPYLNKMWHDAVLIARKGQDPVSTDRRDKIYELSRNYMRNDDFISLNPVLDQSLWKTSIDFLCKLYLDTGSGYSEQNALKKICPVNGTHISIKFTDLPSDLKAFRLDPCEQSCIISDLNVKINKKDISFRSSNAVKSIIKNNRHIYLFDTHDPQFRFTVPSSETPNEIEIGFDISMVSQNIIECI